MIDEKQLIEELRKYADELGTVRGEIELANGVLKAISIINEQPKVGEWIPVEERLPEEAGVYRVTCLYDDKVYRVKDDLFYSDRTWGYDNRNRKVIAWKPLEKPYRVPLENNSKGEPK